jgi:uncharacterized protein (DUF433 family)
LSTLAPVIFNPLILYTCVCTVLGLYYRQTYINSSTVRQYQSITVHPEIQDGAPVFSGTRVRIETFYDFMRIGVSVNEFLDEFPSITRDQALEVYDLVKNQYSLDQIKSLADGPVAHGQSSSTRIYATNR